MRILTRYVLRAHVGPFLFAVGVLTGLLFVNTVAKRFEDELAGKGLPADVIAEVFFLSLPHVIALTLPMGVLVAVLYAFSNLAAENEVTALKASGVNLVRLMIAPLVAATVIAAGMVWFNDRILPETNHRLALLLSDINRKSPTFTLKEQVVNEIRAGEYGTNTYFLRANRIEPGTNRLWDVVIYDLSRPLQRRTIYADSGKMAFNLERTDLFLTLYDGTLYETERQQPARFQRLDYNRQLIRIPDIGSQLERTIEGGYRSDREMSLGMLRHEILTRKLELDSTRTESWRESRQAVERALAGPDAAADGPLRDRPGVSPAGEATSARPLRDRSTVLVAEEEAASEGAASAVALGERTTGLTEGEPANAMAAGAGSLGERAGLRAPDGDTAAMAAAIEDGGVTAKQNAARAVVVGAAKAAPAAALRSGPTLDAPGSPRIEFPARLAVDQRRWESGLEDPLVRRTAMQHQQWASSAELLQLRINQYSVEYHKKWAIPFACIVFVLIGAPLAVRFPRGGVGMVIAASLVIFGIYYVGLIGGEQLADDGHVPAPLAMWFTNGLFLLIGLWAITRIGREGATSRGGGWEDLRQTIVGIVTRVRTDEGTA